MAATSAYATGSSEAVAGDGDCDVYANEDLCDDVVDSDGEVMDSVQDLDGNAEEQAFVTAEVQRLDCVARDHSILGPATKIREISEAHPLVY